MSFLRNIVNDMWEKRLLPVAVVLLLAAAAIPLLLLKSERSQPQAGKEPAATSKQGKTASAAQSIVTLDDQLKLERKKLDAFKKKDPFIQQGLGRGLSSSTVTVIDSADSGTTSGGDTSTGDTGSGGKTDSGDTGTPSTGNGGSTGKLFTLTVTLRFGLLGKGYNGDDKVKKNVVPVTPFPSAKNPIASFIGISSNSPSAIFLLDRGVRQKGEGTCMPSSSYCQLLYLRVESDRNEHTFYRASDPDRKYGIKLKSIDLTSVTEEDIFEAKASKSWHLK